jgi:hypothetical protein
MYDTIRKASTDPSLYRNWSTANAVIRNMRKPTPSTIAAPRSAILSRQRLRTWRMMPRSCAWLVLSSR